MRTAANRGPVGLGLGRFFSVGHVCAKGRSPSESRLVLQLETVVNAKLAEATRQNVHWSRTRAVSKVLVAIAIVVLAVVATSD